MSVASEDSNVDSPCIGVCTLHSTGYCIGCWRSMDEISNWLTFSQPQRQAMMQTTLPERQQAYFDSID